MNCQDIRERLPALIDQELEPAERAEVEKHLAECPDCQKEKNRQEKFTTSVKVSLEGLRPSDRFIKRVIEKLPEGDQEAREAGAAAARKKTAVSLIVALVIIVLAVAITVALAARRKAEEKQGPSGAPVPVQPQAPQRP